MSVAEAEAPVAAPAAPAVGDAAPAAAAAGGGVAFDLRRCCAGGGVGDGLLLRFSATLRPLALQRRRVWVEGGFK